MKYLQSVTAALRRAQMNERAARLLILLFAFALRVYRLDAQAIWWDESLSLYRATRDLGTVLANTILIQNVVTVDTLPQLYFICLHFFVRAFGISEFALRFFSVAANVATISLSYVLARRWLSGQAALITALLGALSPFYVWYAQEARPYVLVLFWSTLAVYALARARVIASEAIAKHPAGKQSPNSNFGIASSHKSLLAMTRACWIFVYILASVAALFTHYFALFLLPFHAVLILILVWQTPRWRWLVFLPVLPFASVIFLFRQVAASAAGNVGTGPYFVPLAVMLRDLLNSFSVGVTVDLAQAGWIDAVMLALFVIGLAIPNSQFASRRRIAILAYVFIPVVGVEILSIARPLYQNSRYLIAISPAFYLGVAAGVVTLTRWWRPWVLPALGVFLIGAAISLNNLYFDPRFGKDDHRAWAEYLRARVRPGDFLILDSPHTEELYRYYAGNRLPMTTLPVLRADGVESPDADLQAVRDAYRKNARVWFLEMDVPFDDPQRRIEKLLNQEGVLLDRVNFPGTSTEIALSLFVPAFPVANVTDIAHPLDIAFAGHLRLRGYDAPASVGSSARGVVKLYWQIDEPVGEDYAVSLRLVDGAGTRVGQWDAILLGNRAGTLTWEPKKIVVDAHDLPMIAGAPPGKYRLQVVPYHSATGTALGDVVPLGEIQVW